MGEEPKGSDVWKKEQVNHLSVGNRERKEGFRQKFLKEEKREHLVTV